MGRGDESSSFDLCVGNRLNRRFDDVAADAPSQPLTRFECDKAGMHWNEEANVCGAEFVGGDASLQLRLRPTSTASP